MDKQREHARSSPKRTGGSAAHAQRRHGSAATGKRRAGTRGREAAGKRLGLTSGRAPERTDLSEAGVRSPPITGRIKYTSVRSWPRRVVRPARAVWLAAFSSASSGWWLRNFAPAVDVAVCVRALALAVAHHLGRVFWSMSRPASRALVFGQAPLIFGSAPLVFGQRRRFWKGGGESAGEQLWSPGENRGCIPGHHGPPRMGGGGRNENQKWGHTRTGGHKWGGGGSYTLCGEEAYSTHSTLYTTNYSSVATNSTKLLRFRGNIPKEMTVLHLPSPLPCLCLNSP